MIKMENKTNQFDAIVIGSGIGGLTTASLLSRIGKRKVLVLESHFKLGGFTHSFKRKQYEWDAGVHYVGEMYPKALSRKIMDLVTGKNVEWSRMGPIMERYFFPDVSFDVASDPQKFMDDLIERFPAEAVGIRKYFKLLKSMQGWSIRWFIGKTLPRPFANALTWMGRNKAGTPTQVLLDSIFKDPSLKAILAGQWPDYGTPPDESAFALHATVMADFLHGAFYPVGGSKGIAEGAQKVIENAGEVAESITP
ncbi:MAG: NAD(P)-binding protein [Pirellulaceae bacterium]